jgi:hypothetical protein
MTSYTSHCFTFGDSCRCVYPQQKILVMISPDIALPLLARILLVILFPFSALDQDPRMECRPETGEFKFPPRDDLPS